MSEPVTGHRYDSGPKNTHGPCIADVNPEHHPYAACRRPEGDHRHSEYSEAASAPGDMHEPRPYPASSLEWTTKGLVINEND